MTLHKKVPAFPISRRWIQDAATLQKTSNVIPFSSGPPKTDVFAPRDFKEYVGQARAKEICEIIVEAAKLEKRDLPNILVHGSYGLGKTTLARLLMDRYGEPKRVVDASAVTVDMLRGYLLIEEIHNLPIEVADIANTRMDAGVLHVVGTTTNPGQLPAAFRSRLRSIALEDYNVKDIETILRNSLKRKGTGFSPKAVTELAKRSRLNPRNALQILSFALELTVILKSAKLTAETVENALSKLDIDERGLTGQDRKYLIQLSFINPTGLSQICAVLGTDHHTVENEIEPFLLQQGFIQRTPRGRILSKGVFDDDLTEMLRQSIEQLSSDEVLQ